MTNETLTAETGISALPRMVQGFAILPPIVGRIAMGRSEWREGRDGSYAMPVADDHFSVTTLVQNEDRTWPDHPIMEKLQKTGEKLLSIPVRIAYDDPSLTIQNSHCAFDAGTGRPICTGHGAKARRVTEDGIQETDCPGPEHCGFGQNHHCKTMTRAYFQIEGQEDEMGVFILRSTSWNTLGYLASRIARLYGLTQGQIAGMPLLLTIREKSTTRSDRRPIFHADLVQRPGMSLVDAIKKAKEYHDSLTQAGLSQQGLEDAARLGLANGALNDDIEDLDEWLGDDAILQAAVGNLGLSQGASGMKGLDAVRAGTAVPAHPSDSLPSDPPQAPAEAGEAA